MKAGPGRSVGTRGCCRVLNRTPVRLSTDSVEAGGQPCEPRRAERSAMSKAPAPAPRPAPSARLCVASPMPTPTAMQIARIPPALDCEPIMELYHRGRSLVSSSNGNLSRRVVVKTRKPRLLGALGVARSVAAPPGVGDDYAPKCGEPTRRIMQHRGCGVKSDFAGSAKGRGVSFTCPRPRSWANSSRPARAIRGPPALRIS
jgi:hypothetical protein